jgi:hypothetical protein
MSDLPTQADRALAHRWLFNARDGVADDWIEGRTPFDTDEIEKDVRDLAVMFAKVRGESRAEVAALVKGRDAAIEDQNKSYRAYRTILQCQVRAAEFLPGRIRGDDLDGFVAAVREVARRAEEAEATAVENVRFNHAQSVKAAQVIADERDALRADVESANAEIKRLREALTHVQICCVHQKAAVAEHKLTVELPYLQLAIDAAATALSTQPPTKGS